MKNRIYLNEDIFIDTPKLIEGGMVILANSGGGKSWAIRKIAEEAVGDKQVIILDPEGEFASLREKYDFILAGKNADVPVEVRSASLLATRLLELGKSAVIDLYELHPQERQRYVKLFCEALVNCPKELYHPVLIILDEAHEYVPEGKPSEATWAVESLASKGRKRGQRLILASQRISKLSKNASAECNNKLIGRASQDIDMKRAGDELGFNKEKLVELRQLKPGEFFAFGPAISDEVVKVKVGDVKTQHAKVGYMKSAKVPPPSHVIKKILGELADLPQEAEQEAKTIAEFKTQIRQLKTELTHNKGGKSLAPDLKDIQKHINQAITKTTIELNKEIKNWEIYASYLETNIIGIGNQFTDWLKKRPKQAEKFRVFSPNVVFKAMEDLKPGSVFQLPPAKIISMGEVSAEEVKPVTGGALRMLKVLVSRYPIKLSKSQLGTFSKMKPSSGTYRIYLSQLKTQGLVEVENDMISASSAGLEFIGEVPNPPQSTEEVIAMWKENLTGGARRMFEVLTDNHPREFSKQELASASGMSETSGTFRIYLSVLKSNGLVEVRGDMVRLSEDLFF